MMRATIFAGSAIAIVLCAEAALAGQAPTPSAANGKALFMTQACYFCHGTVGQGAGPTGARIGPPSRAAAGFIAYVRRPAGAMPAYSETLVSDAGLADIYAFLRAVPPAKAATEVPLLAQLKRK